MYAARHAAFQTWKSLNESVRPAQTSSTFEKDKVRVGLPDTPIVSSAAPHGRSQGRCVAQRLTPQEFEAAGDFLVHAYPTWSWCAPTSTRASAPVSMMLANNLLHDSGAAVMCPYLFRSVNRRHCQQGGRQCIKNKAIPPGEQAISNHSQR